MRHLLKGITLSLVLSSIALGGAEAESFSLASKGLQKAYVQQINLAYKKSVLPFAQAKSIVVGSNKSVPQIFVEQSGFLWDLGGDRLIAMVGAISDDASPVDQCVLDSDNPLDDHCDWAVWRSSSCYFFVTRLDGHLVGAYKVEPYARKWGFKGRPRCSEVLAVAESKSVPPGILLTLRFNDSMDDASARVQAAGNVDTFLFVPRREGDTIKFVQTNDCLAKVPAVSTVTRAREVLRSCDSK